MESNASGGFDRPESDLPPPLPSDAPAPDAARRRRSPPRARLEIGGVIGTSFRVWSANFGSFLALTLLVHLPYIALVLWVQSAPRTQGFQLGWVFVDIVISTLLGFVVTGAVIMGVFGELRGQRIALGAMLSHGLARLPAVLGVSFAVGACIIAPCLPAGLVYGLGFPATSVILAVMAFVFIIVINCGLWIAVPVAVVERPGMIESLRRSWTLTRGYKGHIFMIVLVFALAAILVAMIVAGIAYAIAGLKLGWIEIFLSIFITSIQAVVVAVVYHDLRASVEGLDAKDLARVFD